MATGSGQKEQEGLVPMQAMALRLTLAATVMQQVFSLVSPDSAAHL